MQAIERHIVPQDWVTVLLMAILVLLVVAKQRYSERFYDFSRILFSNKYFTSHKKSLQILNVFSFLLFFCQLLIISWGLYLILNQLDFYWGEARNALFFIQLLIGYIIFIGVKYLLEKILASIFSIEKFIDNYLFYKITYKNFIALGILPVLVLFSYALPPSRFTLFIGLGMVAFFNVLILLSYYKKHQKTLLPYWFYFILYLCTLEIAPYFILFKVFTL